MEYLFVYGTLLQSIESSITAFLKSQGQLLGEGRTTGQLYDLGQYPGLVHTPEATTWVYGQVMTLDNPTDVWPILDTYEMMEPNGHPNNEYRREQIPVWIDDEMYSCWAYLYNRSPRGLTIIPSGHYLDFLDKNGAHWAFINANK
ncbi:MAG: gamma-glutamylcyclotransferase [Lewinellaceae bacterium]|nr:gamma-glutamylcyclotransferase [Lewinellaceae bacterium]